MQIIPKLLNYASEKRLEIVLKHTLVDRQTYRLYKEKMLIIQHVFFLQRKEEMLHCKWKNTSSFTRFVLLPVKTNISKVWDQ